MIGPAIVSLIRGIWLINGEWTIFLVKFADFPSILALQDHIVVELKSQGRSSKLGPRESGQRAKIDAVDCTGQVEDCKEQERSSNNSIGLRHR